MVDSRRARPSRVLGPVRIAPTLAVLLTTALAASACGGGGGGHDAASSPAPSKTTSSTTTTTSPPHLAEAPTLTGARGALDDMSWNQASCRPSGGKHTVSGTVRNSTSVTEDYVVTINWINPTNDVLGRGIAVVKGVAPQQKKSWTLSATVESGASACAPNVLRGHLKSGGTSKGTGTSKGKTKGKG